MNGLEGASKKRIAIVGAGASGLGSIVALKEEGIEPICFEASDTFGGTWNYKEESQIGYASLMSTTVINHSKEMGAISNFPPKKEYSNYMKHNVLYQYITEYYKYHDCEKFIEFNSEVINVRKAENYEDTGRICVTVKNKISGKVSTDVYDGVVIAVGHFNYPKIEKFPGIEKFKGPVMHTHSLKTAEKFKDKRVLVIGSGCSGLDAAEVISSVAKQVYLSCRNGAFILNRVGPNGYPIDYVLLRKYLTTLLEILPADLCSWYIETFYINNTFNKNFYYIKPKYHFLSKDPIINDVIAYKLLSGSVIQKGAVKHFTEKGVVFEGEDGATEIDAVIMATGYTWKYPFLEEGLLQTENGRINLYKCMYPTHLPHSTLVFVGFINPLGPGTPVGELQCRFAAQVFAGNVKLPSNDAMLKETIERYVRNEKRYPPSHFLSIQVDCVSYADDIASQFGAKPNLLKYFFIDLPLFLKLVFGPSLPYQYRLDGPHKWKGAREAIMTANERVHWPLSRQKKTSTSILQIIFDCSSIFIPRFIFGY